MARAPANGPHPVGNRSADDVQLAQVDAARTRVGEAVADDEQIVREDRPVGHRESREEAALAGLVGPRQRPGTAVSEEGTRMKGLAADPARHHRGGWSQQRMQQPVALELGVCVIARRSHRAVDLQRAALPQSKECAVLPGIAAGTARPPDAETDPKLGPVGMVTCIQDFGLDATYAEAERDTVPRGHEGAEPRGRAVAHPALRQASTAGATWHANITRRHG